MFTDASCVEEPNSSPVIHDCVFGDTSSSSTVVVYGDSFALEWVPALNEMGLLHDFRVVVYARYGCPFASVGVEDWLGTVDAGCAPFRNGVIHAITTMSPAPSLVLLSEETEHTSTAGTWGGITTEIWSEAIRVSLHRLGAPAAPIAVVLGTPYAWTDPSSCLAGNAHNATFCDTSLTAAFHQQEYASVARAVRSVGAATVNVESLFCSSSCPDVVGDTLVHSDRWHIASPYVLYAERGLISLIGCAGDTLTLQSTATRSLLGSLLPTLRQPSVRAACESASRSNL